MLDGIEFIVASVSVAERPGYSRLSGLDARLVVQEWVHRHGVSLAADLCRSLGVWRSAEPPGNAEACFELLASRFDDYVPDLVLYRRDRISIAADLNPGIAEVVDLVAAMDLVEEDDTHWVQIAFHDAEGNPLADVQCRIERPDGIAHEGRTNAAGMLWVGDISLAGTCKVSFPELKDDVLRAFGASA